MTKAQYTLAVGVLATAIGCGGSNASSPTSPTAIARNETSAPLSVLVARAAYDPSGAALSQAVDHVFRPTAVTFPPRNEPLEFRNALEAKYRDGLRRGAVETYVDGEGTVVWATEYLRYRIDLCSHADAVSRVMSQIDGLGVLPSCGSSATATFPPRNEPLAFMQQLEAKYRDSLRRTAGSSFVDVEGNIVWTQEYLRYRVSGCSHASAQQKVFDQIDGRGVQADCAPLVAAPSPRPPTSGLSCGAPSIVTCINGGGQGTPTALCSDGAWSCSTTASGTCSGHGGISCRVCPGALCQTASAPTPAPSPAPAPAPAPAPPSRTRTGATCKDGTSSTATGSGACSSHGGVQCWKYSDGTCTNP